MFLSGWERVVIVIARLYCYPLGGDMSAIDITFIVFRFMLAWGGVLLFTGRA